MGEQEHQHKTRRAAVVDSLQVVQCQGVLAKWLTSNVIETVNALEGVVRDCPRYSLRLWSIWSICRIFFGTSHDGMDGCTLQIVTLRAASSERSRPVGEPERRRQWRTRKTKIFRRFQTRFSPSEATKGDGCVTAEGNQEEGYQNELL